MRGKGFEPVTRSKRSQDHPRLCGEKPATRPLDARTAGSPPPMRGKGEVSFDGKTVTGITPAYAGKSFQFTHFLFPPWDHPRLCGEKDRLKALSNGELGSPPPMRGKGHLQLMKPQPAGITPAYAGKSTLTEGWSAGT